MEDNLKDTLRKNMLHQRKSMKIQDVSNFSNKIIGTIMELPEFTNCKNIMLYLSFNKEVDTYPLAKWCLDNGKTVIAPYCIQSKREIIPFKINNLTTDLSKSSIGVMEPKHDSLDKVNIEDIDLIIVPGVVFDKHCNRIGFGAGYYDRFLPKKTKLTPTIGIAYDYQIVDKVPTGEYDVPLGFIITEKRIIFPE
ncbi:5-formyltetrahydrofolate cyclo-ligase [Clostridium sp. CM028]|uniref:5-formyltetrahydrofolate cyclo-ligase n=1 Tax=Clostridium sp. CM028 TaxID=2851575 RepID=UPI001C6EDAE1|nr:5-formyltetrahydrofolate cyclo-ligase [Clostridium sp. CM028]MBW9147976.1 5-formyltetrahydrofolate cyclo-ligase [Clostridium sp. CM028]WLC61404.1 5-formyltetrahydrofolate cyclo-ligase [Clostridium sp. CM028]